MVQIDSHLDGRTIWTNFIHPFDRLIVLGFNNMSTLVGHFVSSPREREKKDRRDSRGDEREGQGRKRNRNESEEIEISPSTLTCYKDGRPCPNCKPISVGHPGEVRYMTPSPHPTTSPLPILLFRTLIMLLKHHQEFSASLTCHKLSYVPLCKCLNVSYVLNSMRQSFTICRRRNWRQTPVQVEFKGMWSQSN